MPVHGTSLTFPLPDPSSARAVLQALELEVADGPEGSETTLSLDDHVVRAEVTADTVSGLRAAVNSVVRLLDAAARVV